MADGFIKNLREYGLKNLLTDVDFVLSLIVLIISLSGQYIFEISLVSSKFVQLGTNVAISLLAFILTGLAVMATFSDADFLALLKKLGIYRRIMFVFQFDLYLAIGVTIYGIILQSYGLSPLRFFLFVFVFTYLMFSLSKFVDMIISLGERQAIHQNNN